MGKKLLFRWSRDQFSAKRAKWLHFSVGLGFGIGLGLWYDSGYWLVFGFRLGLGFGSEIRAQGLASDLVKADFLILPLPDGTTLFLNTNSLTKTAVTKAE